ncbi:MAG: 2,3,4,5-tetrahydropyridine-2,6-dicarboxylate N-succinyltransferase, partial [Alphaproteobacteria bacterium]
MSDEAIRAAIEAAWQTRDALSPRTKGVAREAVEAALEGLDQGRLRVAENVDGQWCVNQWLKMAVLLSFRLTDSTVMPGGPGARGVWFDKVANKFDGWDDARFRAAGFRAVPDCVVRRSAYIAPGVVLMPSFVNVGAYV